MLYRRPQGFWLLNPFLLVVGALGEERTESAGLRDVSGAQAGDGGGGNPQQKRDWQGLQAGRQGAPRPDLCARISYIRPHLRYTSRWGSWTHILQQ